MDPTIAANYLKQHGGFCPHCHRTDQIRRLLGDRKSRIDPDGRRHFIPCYCAGCGEEWLESYRLEGVHDTADWPKG
jgi:hypothetical protein